jgi:hypothetical protein
MDNQVKLYYMFSDTGGTLNSDGVIEYMNKTQKPTKSIDELLALHGNGKVRPELKKNLKFHFNQKIYTVDQLQSIPNQGQEVLKSFHTFITIGVTVSLDEYLNLQSKMNDIQ